jgi:carbamoylphosphate synthase small subunit
LVPFVVDLHSGVCFIERPGDAEIDRELIDLLCHPPELTFDRVESIVLFVVVSEEAHVDSPCSVCGWVRASTIVRLMNVDCRALVDMARVSGFIAPYTVAVGVRIQLSTEEEARQTLAELRKFPRGRSERVCVTTAP